MIQAIDRDTKFLQEMGVIDYSLLMGIDTVDMHLVIGIVDSCRGSGMAEKAEKARGKTYSFEHQPGQVLTLFACPAGVQRRANCNHTGAISEQILQLF